MASKKQNSKDVIALLRRMWLIRAFEEKVSALYAERQIVGLLHLGHWPRSGRRRRAELIAPMTIWSMAAIAPTATPSPRART